MLFFGLVIILASYESVRDELVVQASRLPVAAETAAPQFGK
jgi:hypothetical protein